MQFSRRLRSSRQMRDKRLVSSAAMFTVYHSTREDSTTGTGGFLLRRLSLYGSGFRRLRLVKALTGSGFSASALTCVSAAAG